MLQLSLLNDFLYCPRRAALKIVEGWREANEHTVRGDIVHEHADLPGYEAAKGVTLWRALPVFSDRLGLNGKCDIVEVHPVAPQNQTTLNPQPSTLNSPVGVLCPVEYKKGKRRQFENDDAQLCAQALCLEEMFGQRIERGAIFHAASKRRREVEFTAQLRKLTEAAVAELHAMLDSPPSASNAQLPPAVFKPACQECSLYEICLPQVTSHPARLAQAAEKLFQT
jgi:CRISPR-associated exonuclease Cas4